KHRSTVLVHKKVNNYQVAPNSRFDYLVSDSSNQLGAGKYTLDMHLQSGKRKWHLVKDFVITSKQGAPLTKQTGWLGISMMLWIVVIILILIIASLVEVIMWKRKKFNS